VAVRVAGRGLRVVFERDTVEGELRVDFDRWFGLRDSEAVPEAIGSAVASLLAGDEPVTLPRDARERITPASLRSIESGGPSTLVEPGPALWLHFDGSLAAIATAVLLRASRVPFGLFHVVPVGGGGWWGQWAAEQRSCWQRAAEQFGPAVVEIRTNILGTVDPPGWPNPVTPSALASWLITDCGGGVVLQSHAPSDSKAVRLLRAQKVAVLGGVPGLSEIVQMRIATSAGFTPITSGDYDPLRMAYLRDAFDMPAGDAIEGSLWQVFDIKGCLKDPETWAYIAAHSARFRRGSGGSGAEDRIRELVAGLPLEHLDAFDPSCLGWGPTGERALQALSKGAERVGIEIAQAKHLRYREQFETVIARRAT